MGEPQTAGPSPILDSLRTVSESESGLHTQPQRHGRRRPAMLRPAAAGRFACGLLYLCPTGTHPVKPR